MSRPRFGAFVLLCSLVLAGCSQTTANRVGDEPATSDSPSTDAPTGDSIRGRGFYFNAPGGWQSIEQYGSLAANFLAGAAERAPTDNFGDNLNIIASGPSDRYDDLVFVVTFSIDLPESERRDITSSVLATWQWTT